MNNFFKKPEIKYAFAAVVASLLFGIFTNLLPQKISQKDPMYGYGSDSDIYWDLAGNLAFGKGFMNSPGFVFAYLHKTTEYTYSTQRLPGYPAVLAVIRWLNPASLPNGWGVRLFNLCLVFLNTYFIISIIRTVFSKVEENLFWLIAFFPMFLIHSNGINSDFFSLVLLSGFAFLMLQKNNYQWLALMLGVWAVFTRGNSLFFILPFYLFCGLMFRKNKRAVLLSLSGIVAVALVFCAWSWRNYKLSEHFVYAPYTGLQLRQNYIYKIYRYTQPAGEEQYSRWRSPEFLKNRFETLAQTNNLYAAEAILDKELIRDTFGVLWLKKITSLKVFMRDVAQMFTNEYLIFNLAREFNQPWLWTSVWLVALLFFTIPSILLLFTSLIWIRKKKISFLTILYSSSVIYLLLTAAVLGDFARYLVPVGFAICISLINILQSNKELVIADQS